MGAPNFQHKEKRLTLGASLHTNPNQPDIIGLWGWGRYQYQLNTIKTEVKALSRSRTQGRASRSLRVRSPEATSPPLPWMAPD